MSKDKVNIELSRSEALVLFEFASRFSHESKLEIKDQSEERVLWNVCALLESALVEPLEENYHEALAAAREEVRDKEA